MGKNGKKVKNIEHLLDSMNNVWWIKKIDGEYHIHLNDFASLATQAQ